MRVFLRFAKPEARTRVSGFTLIELVMVMAIMLMVLGFAAPSVVGILKGKKIEQALSTVTGVLEQARMEAAREERRRADLQRQVWVCVGVCLFV